MLKHLQIENLILIDRADIAFENGFNVLTGETGAGKSAILTALRLIAGERGDSAFIRSGCSSCTIEALFDLSGIAEMAALLQEMALMNSDDEAILLVRRELLVSGKGRIWVNHHLVQLSLLKKLQLIQISGQHASLQLLDLDKQRSLLDVYGGCDAETQLLSKQWHKEQQLKRELAVQYSQKSEQFHQRQLLRSHIEEIDQAHLDETEEEELFAEYTDLSHVQERSGYLKQAITYLETAYNSFARMQSPLDRLVAITPAFSENQSSFTNAYLEMQELNVSLQRALSHCIADPHRLEMIEKRLKQLDAMKKKYGATLSAIKEYREQALSEVEKLSKAHIDIAKAEEELASLAAHNQSLADNLTIARQKTAGIFARALAAELHELNMDKAEVRVDIARCPLTAQGQDCVEIFLIPNVGEREIALKSSASGGEQARVMLALQVLLAGKLSSSCLVFDEIDSGIGGATATLIGMKLRRLAHLQLSPTLRHQILCITHFPQVARYADHHLFICKKEQGGRTLTTITSLSDSERACELKRMQGELQPLARSCYG